MERKAGKDMTIIHTAHMMMEEAKAASLKGEENGQNVQREPESDPCRKERQREKKRGSKRD